jgi:hypothetical protein
MYNAILIDIFEWDLVVEEGTRAEIKATRIPYSILLFYCSIYISSSFEN